MKLNLVSILMLCSVHCNPVFAQEMAVIPYKQDTQYSKYTRFVVAGILEQMGLPFPEEQKIVDPQPQPSPSPDPQPAPQPKPKPKPKPDSEEGFFDDDFFEEDLSFEEMNDAMEKEYTDTVSAWEKEYKETVERWEKARKGYLKKEKQYQDKLSPLASVQSSAALSDVASTQVSTAPTLNFSQMKAGQFHVIPGAMDIPIRDQQGRSTCAAFAAVRGMETVLNQHDVIANLSEQYYYWLAKPDCAMQPCATKTHSGSNIALGLLMALHPSVAEKQQFINSVTQKGQLVIPNELVQLSNAVGIIDEADCRYVPTDLPAGNNETMTPLQCNLRNPGVNTKNFSAPRQDQLVDTLLSNRPIVAGFRLSTNFYRDKGVITYANRDKYGDSSKHDGGHAVLLVGVVKLPQSLQQEGRYCLITANSWGEGWGRGGYGCLTEKWVSQFGREGSYFALDSVEASNDFLQRTRQ